jgi:hypothetical protein
VWDVAIYICKDKGGRGRGEEKGGLLEQLSKCWYNRNKNYENFYYFLNSFEQMLLFSYAGVLSIQN